MTLSAQKMKMRYTHKSNAAVVCAKLKAVSKLIAIYLYVELLHLLINTAHPE
jgi:hypothetical protein